MPDKHDIPHVELFQQLREVVGIGVQVIALPRLARTAVTAPVEGYAAVPTRCQEEHLSSNASALSGHPWLNTIGSPVPQSLKYRREPTRSPVVCRGSGTNGNMALGPAGRRDRKQRRNADASGGKQDFAPRWGCI